MAEEKEEKTTPAETTEPSQEPRKSNKKSIIIIAVAVGLVAIVAITVLVTGVGKKWMGHDSKSAPDSGHPTTEASAEPAKEEPPAKLQFVELPTMMVNLANSSNKKTYFMRIKVSLEVGSDEDAKYIKDMMPKVIDLFQTYLRQITFEDIDDSSGSQHLREELLTRLNSLVTPRKVRDVLFLELVTQ